MSKNKVYLITFECKELSKYNLQELKRKLRNLLYNDSNKQISGINVFELKRQDID